MTITKLIKAYFLTVFCAVSLFAATTQSVGIVTAEELQLMKAYPFTFKGYDPNATMPADVAAALPNFDTLDMSVEANRKIFNKAFEYYRAVVLGYIKQCINYAGEDKKPDLQNIMHRASSKNVGDINGLTFSLDLIRAQSCVAGSVSSAETELFKNSPSKEFFAMFFEVEKDGERGPAWKLLSDSELYKLITDEHDRLPGVNNITNGCSSGYSLSETVRQLIAKRMREDFPCEHFPVLVPGNTHLGITFFVRAILAEICPIALPYPGKPIPEVHGVQMTALSFHWHDYLHGEIDQHAQAPRNWAGDMIYSILHRHPNLSFRAVVPQVISHTGQMYKSVKKLFGALIDAAQQRFASSAAADLNGAKQQYNKVLHSLFYLLHEINALDKELYESVTLEAFVNKLISDSQSEIMDNDDYAILAQSGIDVLTASDEVLRNWALDNLKIKSGFFSVEGVFTQSGVTWRESIGQRQFVLNVSRGEILTKFTVEFNDGSTIESLQESMQYILSSAEDSEWLLKAAGFVRASSMVKPDAGKATKAEFVSYIADLNGRLNAMLDGLKNFYLEVKTDVAIAAAEAEYTRARAAINTLYDPTPNAESRAAAASTTVTAVGSVPTIVIPQSFETK